jgi:hypothetical protein
VQAIDYDSASGSGAALRWVLTVGAPQALGRAEPGGDDQPIWVRCAITTDPAFAGDLLAGRTSVPGPVLDARSHAHSVPSA